MAHSMLTLTEMPAGVPGKELREWLPETDLEFLSTFGVQMVRDPDGFPVLLSYAQDTPLTNTSRSIQAAESKARVGALANLRFFAGSQLKASEDFLNSENIEEFADGTESYSNQSFFQEKIDVIAPPQKFSGISTIHQWNVTHPLTNRMTVGVVVAWSPQSALLANQVERQMDQTPRRSPGGSSLSTQRGPRDNQGLDGGRGVRGSADF
jgi:hypothetical protein